MCNYEDIRSVFENQDSFALMIEFEYMGIAIHKAS